MDEFKKLAKRIQESRKEDRDLREKTSVPTKEIAEMISSSQFRKQLFEFFFLASSQYGNNPYQSQDIALTLKVHVRKLYNAINDFVHCGLLTVKRIDDCRKKCYKMVKIKTWIDIAKIIYEGGEE